MKNIIRVTLLAVSCAVILTASSASAKSNCSFPGYKNCADVCRDVVPVFESLGYGLTMGQCVSANESGNPAMALCRNLQVGNPFLFDELFGNLGQCLKEMNGSLPRK